MFEPISRNDFIKKEHKRDTESIIFLVQKRFGKIKAWTVEDGGTQRAYINRDDVAIPMSASDAIIFTGVIESKQGRDVMINDVPENW